MTMQNMSVGRLCTQAVFAPHSPHIVIDAEGHEVGVVVDYAQYLALMELLAAEPGRNALPHYWQRALDGCLLGFARP